MESMSKVESRKSKVESRKSKVESRKSKVETREHRGRPWKNHCASFWPWRS
ncbi:6-phosphofructokinase [Natronospirillum operosum]|uniref:6-phosphofructokinase n=1 Tax=Natronospirillum operosum TaxID=2759953 RepID=A0A4Z0W642_9GAMM|nr:6-phosphofructokinase [Natronospirillum operosum]